MLVTGCLGVPGLAFAVRPAPGCEETRGSGSAYVFGGALDAIHFGPGFSQLFTGACAASIGAAAEEVRSGLGS